MDTSRLTRFERFVYKHATTRATVIAAIVLAVAVIVNFSVYFAVFLPLTDGTAYMELNVGYLPSDLFNFAEAYGEEGRDLYVTLSSTLDVAVPLCAATLLALIGYWLGAHEGVGSVALLRTALIASVCACLSDWSENASMIWLLTSYPTQNMTAAVLARIMTSIKYVSMIIAIAVITIEAVRLHRTT